MIKFRVKNSWWCQNCSVTLAILLDFPFVALLPANKKVNSDDWTYFILSWMIRPLLPLPPLSIQYSTVIKPWWSSRSETRLEYFSCFRVWALVIFCSNGVVSSTIAIHFHVRSAIEQKVSYGVHNRCCAARCNILGLVSILQLFRMCCNVSFHPHVVHFVLPTLLAP